MSRAKLLKQFKEIHPNLNASEIDSIIDLFCDSLKNAICDHKKVVLRGFGTFLNQKIKEKFLSRNPRTGRLIYTPEKNKIRFKASKKLIKLINK